MELAVPTLLGARGLGHPAIAKRRRRELCALVLTAAVPLALTLAIATAVPDPNPFLAIGMVVGFFGIVALMVSDRYEITLTVLALYLGLVDGVVKLEAPNQLTSSVRDVLIAAVCVGALARLVVRREKIRLPPLSGWVIAFVALVLVEAANPNNLNALKILGGFRQQLEWIPFFFFGYLLMRSKSRFRKFFVLIGVIALANGLVATYQTQLTPEQLSSWGPGYAERVNGTGGVAGRTYVDSTGKSRVRPPGLGSDLGFGGVVGVLALPGLLTLLVIGRRRWRWLVLLLCLMAVVAIATSLQRQAVLGGAIAVLAFLMLSVGLARRAGRVLAGILVVGVISLAMAAVLVPVAGEGLFSRYADIAPGKAASTSVDYREGTWSEIPAVLEKYPFGAGLSTVGAGIRFGGDANLTLDGRPLGAESQYNYVSVELGVFGLVYWLALTGFIIALAIRRLRSVGDQEIRLSLVAIFASVIAFSAMGLTGPTMASLPFGPFFWFALGIASYWLAGGRQRDERAKPRPEEQQAPAVPAWT